MREITLLVVTVAIVLAVGVFKPGFMAYDNLEFMVLGAVVLGLIAIGQTFVIMTKGIDLSVSAVMGLSAMIFGLASTTSHLGLAVALPLCLVMGAMLGSINGLMVAWVRIPPIIATLGTYSLFGGITFIVSNGTQVDQVSRQFAAFGNDNLIPGLPVPIPVIALTVVALLAWYVLHYTIFGRNILAVGNNASAAYNAGIPVKRTLLRVYMISGALAAFGGLVFVAYTGSATATTGTGDHVELQTIAIALIGGTAISGGRGNLAGTVIGSIFLSVVITALVFLHVPAIWYSAGEGLMILAAVSFGGTRGAAR
ncbi:ABC transporter permease [Acidiphilium acidophilum]|uniref:Autoinducer 2 import system permease protein LsrC n=1 Tax=Acidiphilium acidophilum TaxID=76588 RepID=A0AAW9DLL1_ACIAO|nr:ABC transporter permease [Acidiphilium acidophilum]MDX5929580.1 ABC transporter permease [Acidiphilium acidophilum]